MEITSTVSKINAEIDKQKVFANLQSVAKRTKLNLDTVAMDLFNRRYVQLNRAKRLGVERKLAKEKKRVGEQARRLSMKTWPRFRDGSFYDYLRNKVISCSCLAWISQDKNICLCKHQAILLYNLWKEMDSSKFVRDGDYSELEKLFQFLHSINNNSSLLNIQNTNSISQKIFNKNAEWEFQKFKNKMNRYNLDKIKKKKINPFKKNETNEIYELEKCLNLFQKDLSK